MKIWKHLAQAVVFLVFSTCTISLRGFCIFSALSCNLYRLLEQVQSWTLCCVCCGSLAWVRCHCNISQSEIHQLCSSSLYCFTSACFLRLASFCVVLDNECKSGLQTRNVHLLPSKKKKNPRLKILVSLNVTLSSLVHACHSPQLCFWGGLGLKRQPRGSLSWELLWYST
jgi:hypothetical protein